MTESQAISEPDVSRRRFLKLMTAGSVGAIIVACSPGGGDTTPEGEGEGEETTGTQTLRVAWGGPPAALDPLNASADVEIALLNAVYDYLLDTDAENNLVPRLASEWSVSDDGTSYTLTIAEGVTFHNGDALTIDDIIWTFDRLRGGGATESLYANIESVEAGDGNSVVFNLSDTNPDFLYNLTDNHAVILQANAENIGTAFNGTGPFKLDEFIAEDRAVLSANADYFGGTPGIDRLEFIYFGDTEAAVNALQGGTVDAVLRMDNPTFLDLSESDLNAIEIPTSGHDLVRLRADREPGNDERVRRAFKMATDRQTIFDRVQLGFGAEGRDTPISPVYGAYYTEQFDLPPHDPEGAADLLAEAGYEDGLEMTLHVPNSGGRPAMAEALASQWAEAGINVSIELQEEAVYYADDGWLEVDLGITGWGARPVPQIYLDVAYKSGAKWNEAHFSDEDLDEQIEIAGTALDEEERVQAYHEIQRILIERGPVIIPYYFAQFGVFAQNVEGVELHPFAGRTNFDKATLG